MPFTVLTLSVVVHSSLGKETTENRENDFAVLSSDGKAEACSEEEAKET